MRDYGVWPFYSRQCISDMRALLERGGTLSKYRANRDYGAEPQEGSQAWWLERELRAETGAPHAIAANSGTAALHMALAGLGVSGKEVITSPYTFSATAAAILHAGGIPVFADVDPLHGQITPETTQPLVTRRTSAILVVHLFGYVNQMRPWRKLGIPVIEDACQAVGATRRGVSAGTFGIAGAYSFNGTKNVPAGEGGALLTSSARIARRARLVLNHGENFGAPWVGYNYRMNEPTALLARHGLQEVLARNKERRRLSSILSQRLRVAKGILLLPTDSYMPYESSYYVWPFQLLLGDRAAVSKRLHRRGIQVGEGYIRPPLHRYPAFRPFARGRTLPEVDRLSRETLCLLDCVRPPATPSDMKALANAILDCIP